MPTPHKHAALIKAWADGAVIQYKGCGFGDSKWRDTERPTWFPDTEYRIKPKTIRFRVALYNNPSSIAYVVAYHSQTAATEAETHEQFIKWLGPWQEIEI